MCDPAHTFEAADGRTGALLQEFFCVSAPLRKMIDRPFARMANGPALDGFRAMPYKGAYVLALRIVFGLHGNMRLATVRSECLGDSRPGHTSCSAAARMARP